MAEYLVPVAIQNALAEGQRQAEASDPLFWTSLSYAEKNIDRQAPYAQKVTERIKGIRRAGAEKCYPCELERARRMAGERRPDFIDHLLRARRFAEIAGMDITKEFDEILSVYERTLGLNHNAY